MDRSRQEYDGIGIRRSLVDGSRSRWGGHSDVGNVESEEYRRGRRWPSRRVSSAAI